MTGHATRQPGRDPGGLCRRRLGRFAGGAAWLWPVFLAWALAFFFRPFVRPGGAGWVVRWSPCSFRSGSSMSPCAWGYLEPAWVAAGSWTESAWFFSAHLGRLWFSAGRAVPVPDRGATDHRHVVSGVARQNGRESGSVPVHPLLAVAFLSGPAHVSIRFHAQARQVAASSQARRAHRGHRGQRARAARSLRPTRSERTPVRAYLQTGRASQDFQASSARVANPHRGFAFLDLLASVPASRVTVSKTLLDKQSQALTACFADFGIQGEVQGVQPGPVITMFEFKPAPGIKVSRIANMSDDLALALKARAVRIVAPLPGRDTVGIEIPNEQRLTVYLREILDDPAFADTKGQRPLALGKDGSGRVENRRFGQDAARSCVSFARESRCVITSGPSTSVSSRNTWRVGSRRPATQGVGSSTRRRSGSSSCDRGDSASDQQRL